MLSLRNQVLRQEGVNSVYQGGELGNLIRRGKMRGYKFEYLDSQRITFHEGVTTIETENDIL